MGNRLKANGVATVLAILMVLWCHAGWSQIRLVIPEIADDEEGRISQRVTDYFVDRSDYQLLDSRWIAEELAAAGAAFGDFLGDPQAMRDLATTAGFDVLVWGQLDRPRRARLLEISIYEGSSGQPLGTVSIELNRGRIDEEAFDWGMAEVESYILQAMVTPSPEPIQPAEPEPPPRPAEPVTVPTGRSRTWPRQVSGWLVLGIGFDAVHRNMSVVAQEGGIDYTSGFYSGLEGTLELFPLRLIHPGTVLDGLGLRFRLARYLTDTALVREPSDEDLIIPTRHKELGLLLLYRHPLGPFEVGGHVGYQSQAFLLGANEVYTSSQYNGIALGICGRYHIIERLLDTGIEFEIRPGPRLGDPELTAFGGGTSFGFGLMADIGVRFLGRFQAVGFYTLRQYSTSFDGNGNSDLTGTIDTTDTYHLVGLRLHIAY